MGSKRERKGNVDQGFHKTVRVPVYMSPDVYHRLVKVIAYKHYKIETSHTLSGYIWQELILPHVEEVEKEMKTRKAVPA